MRRSDGELQHGTIAGQADKELHHGIDYGGLDDLRPPGVVVARDALIEVVRGHDPRLSRSSIGVRVSQWAADHALTPARTTRMTAMTLRMMATLTKRTRAWPPVTAMAATAQSAKTDPTATETGEW